MEYWVFFGVVPLVFGLLFQTIVIKSVFKRVPDFRFAFLKHRDENCLLIKDYLIFDIVTLAFVMVRKASILLYVSWEYLVPVLRDSKKEFCVN